MLATLGGGCFWCLEAAFQMIRGVRSVQSGYAGGAGANPSYEEVCTGESGHAEVVHVDFLEDVVSYAEILGVFFSAHDPTTLNRQGADVGAQYRSVIFFHSEEQKAVAEALIADLEEQCVWADPIVTEVLSLTKFFPAEPYHQGYYQKNPFQSYCQAVVSPKLRKIREKHSSLLKK